MPKHVLLRTSSLQESYVARCAMCGAEGLSITAADVECPNPFNINAELAVLHACAPEIYPITAQEALSKRRKNKCSRAKVR